MTLLAAVLASLLAATRALAGGDALPDVRYDKVEWAVTGGQAALSCGITRQNYKGHIAVVTLYHNSSSAPVYWVDARSEPLHAAALRSQARGTHLQLHLPRFLQPAPPAAGTHRADDETVKVVVRGVAAADAGHYRCEVTYKSHRTVTTRSYLRVVEGPRHMEVLSSLQDYAKIEGGVARHFVGSNVTFVCLVTGGSPRPTVLWMEGGDVLGRGGAEADSDVATATLTLTNISRSDDGRTLVCVARNTAVLTGLSEQLSEAVQLLVTAPPLYVEISRDDPGGPTRLRPRTVVEATVGQRLTLLCEAAEALGSSGLTWHLDGEALVDQDPYSISASLEEGGTRRSGLSFLPYATRHNSTLTCSAEYPPTPGVMGDLHQLTQPVPLTLRVIGPPTVHLTLMGADGVSSASGELSLTKGVPSVGEEISSTTKELSIMEESDVTLRCAVNSSAPLLAVDFYKDSELLHSALASDSDVASGSDPSPPPHPTEFELPLVRVSPPDGGAYVCRARNRVAGVVSGVLRLVVVGPPRCQDLPAVVGVAQPGVPSPLHCPVTAFPSPDTFRWVLGQGLEPTESPTSLLVFSVPEDYVLPHNVSCVARNSIGSTAQPCLVTLEASGPPKPVRNCEFVPSFQNAKTVHLDVVCEAGWTGGLPTNLTVHVDDLNTSENPSNDRLKQSDVIIPIQSKKVEFHVKKLEVDHKYLLTIFASNELGRSLAVTHSYGPVAGAKELVMETKMETNFRVDELKIIFIVVGTTMVFIVIVTLSIRICRSKKPKYDHIPSMQSSNQQRTEDEYSDQQMSYVHFRNDIDKEALLGQKRHRASSSSSENNVNMDHQRSPLTVRSYQLPPYKTPTTNTSGQGCQNLLDRDLHRQHTQNHSFHYRQTQEQLQQKSAQFCSNVFTYPESTDQPKIQAHLKWNPNAYVKLERIDPGRTFPVPVGINRNPERKYVSIVHSDFSSRNVENNLSSFGAPTPSGQMNERDIATSSGLSQLTPRERSPDSASSTVSSSSACTVIENPAFDRNNQDHTLSQPDHSSPLLEKTSKQLDGENNNCDQEKILPVNEPQKEVSEQLEEIRAGDADNRSLENNPTEIRGSACSLLMDLQDNPVASSIGSEIPNKASERGKNVMENETSNATYIEKIQIEKEGKILNTSIIDENDAKEVRDTSNNLNLSTEKAASSRDPIKGIMKTPRLPVDEMKTNDSNSVHSSGSSLKRSKKGQPTNATVIERSVEYQHTPISKENSKAKVTFAEQLDYAIPYDTSSAPIMVSGMESSQPMIFAREEFPILVENHQGVKVTNLDDMIMGKNNLDSQGIPESSYDDNNYAVPCSEGVTTM